MRSNLTVALVAGGAAAVLAAGSTVAIAAANGAFTSTGAGGYSPVAAGGARTATCTAPTLPGAVVDVTLTDMGVAMGYRGTSGYGGYGGMTGREGMMGASGWWPPGMMSVRLAPTAVPAGRVSLRVSNTGVLTHELVVLPLSGDAQPGQRSVGADGTVSEAGSLGEASNNCGEGEGDGIGPGGAGWVTLQLGAGHYELVCNLPGHYSAGMYAELDVTG